MSTRSQLRFVQQTDAGAVDPTERVAPVYRHSNGYPEAVLADFQRLKRLLGATSTEHGPDSAAAQIASVERRRAMSYYVGTDPERHIRATSPEAMTDPRRFDPPRPAAVPPRPRPR